jgi:hypothetical protein
LCLVKNVAREVDPLLAEGGGEEFHFLAGQRGRCPDVKRCPGSVLDPEAVIVAGERHPQGHWRRGRFLMLSESEPTSAIPLRMESNGMAYLRGLGGRFPATSSEVVWRRLRNRVSAGGDVGRGSSPGPRDPTLPPPARELRTALSVWGELSLGEAAVFLWNLFFGKGSEGGGVVCFLFLSGRLAGALGGSREQAALPR